MQYYLSGGPTLYRVHTSSSFYNYPRCVSDSHSSCFSDLRIHQENPNDFMGIIMHLGFNRAYLSGSDEFQTSASNVLDLSEHVFRLATQLDDNSRLNGTGFLLKVNNVIIGVTSRHNIVGSRSKANNGLPVSLKVYPQLEFESDFIQNPDFESVEAVLLTDLSLLSSRERKVALGFSDEESAPLSSSVCSSSSLMAQTDLVFLRLDHLLDELQPFEINPDTIASAEMGQEMFVIGIPVPICEKRYQQLSDQNESMPKFLSYLRVFYKALDRMIVSRGFVTKVTDELCQHSANTTTGMSGGPVFSRDGKLLGLHVGTQDDCFIPISVLLKELKALSSSS